MNLDPCPGITVNRDQGATKIRIIFQTVFSLNWYPCLVPSGAHVASTKAARVPASRHRSFNKRARRRRARTISRAATPRADLEFVLGSLGIFRFWDSLICLVCSVICLFVCFFVFFNFPFLVHVFLKLSMFSGKSS